MFRNMLAAAGLVLWPLGGAAQESGGQKNLTLIGIPSATVAPDRVGYVAMGFVSDEEAPALGDDGALAFGFGLGNARDALGVQFNTVMTMGGDGGLGESGQLGAKVSRQVGHGSVPVFAALQGDYLHAWGEADNTDPRLRLMLSGFSAFQMGNEHYPVMFTAGVGTDLRNDFKDPGVFFGAGVGLNQAVAASLAWTGESATLGLGVRIPEEPSLSASLAVEDIFNHEDRGRLALSVSWVFNLGRGQAQ